VLTSGFKLGRGEPEFAHQILRQDLAFSLGFDQLCGLDSLSGSTLGREIETLVCEEDQTGGDCTSDHDGDDPPDVRDLDQIPVYLDRTSQAVDPPF
jgi:hypothetical protein